MNESKRIKVKGHYRLVWRDSKGRFVKIEKWRPSKDLRAEGLCGLRPRGTALFFPHELGYACPICGASDEVSLHWSEYRMFLWCEKCNLDIPSCLCVKYPEPKITEKPLSRRMRVERATKVFLDCIAEVLEVEDKQE